jgi:hypothetical protein
MEPAMEPVMKPAEGPAEEVATAAGAASDLGTDLAADPAGDAPEPSSPSEPAHQEPGEPADHPETEEERVARERVEFDKLVAAFHGESAPDPQPNRPDSSAPRKIVRYPVLDPRPEWPSEILEPSDETTSDPLDHVEHYEQPDPPLPQVAAATLASWVMLLGGVGFLVLHTLLQWQTPEYLGWLAVIGVFGGIISLVMRMKPDRDEYDDPDNGAVV